MTKYMMLIVAVAIGGFAQLLLKKGTGGHEITNFQTLIQILSSWQIIIGIVLYGLSFLCWMVGISKVPITTAYPFTILSFVIIIIGGWMMGESITYTKIIGILLVIGGLIFITR